METDSDKKCIYFSGLIIPFSTIGPTDNKSVLNSVAFHSSFFIFLRFVWSEMVPTWMVSDLLSKVTITFSLHLNKLNPYSPMELHYTVYTRINQKSFTNLMIKIFIKYNSSFPPLMNQTSFTTVLCIKVFNWFQKLPSWSITNKCSNMDCIMFMLEIKLIFFNSSYSCRKSPRHELTSFVYLRT